MNYEEKKQRFVQTWGALGSSWGISKTMAQIHALLLISPESLSAEDIMEELSISRGNVNMNVRGLIEWGLVEKDLKLGERKEFFKADKDVERFARAIARERLKKEIEPVQKILSELNDNNGDSPEEKEMENVVGDIADFTNKVYSIMDKFVRSDEHWLYKNALKLLK